MMNENDRNMIGSEKSPGVLQEDPWGHAQTNSETKGDHCSYGNLSSNASSQRKKDAQ